jgi:hypothetical protein
MSSNAFPRSYTRPQNKDGELDPMHYIKHLEIEEDKRLLARGQAVPGIEPGLICAVFIF